MGPSGSLQAPPTSDPCPPPLSTQGQPLIVGDRTVFSECSQQMPRSSKLDTAVCPGTPICLTAETISSRVPAWGPPQTTHKPGGFSAPVSARGAWDLGQAARVFLSLEGFFT